MSSPNVDAVAEEENQPTTQPPPRRFPPPCWTQEETLALIEAYRERWYALRRGYLRTADWDAVAATVISACPDVTPQKTSAQCRHKMEKLRQRYRAEKQRSLACPPGSRFFSSWFFFDNMDAMENGTTVSAVRSAVKSPGISVAVAPDGQILKTIIDQNLLKLKLNSRNGVNPMEDPNMNNTNNFMFNQSNLPTDKSNFGGPTRVVPNGYSPYMEMGSDNKEPTPNAIPIPFSMRNGMPMKAKRPVNFPNYDCDEGSEYTNGNSANDGFHMGSSRRRSYGGVEAKVEPRFNPSSMGKKGVGGVKRKGRDPMEEMVLSIRLLGEGFIKMEKMKMEMAKEVEHMRMEMEMKRNEMILESQKQIVNAFVKVLSEVNKNNKNVKTVSPE